MGSPLPGQETIENFASLAQKFCAWAEGPPDAASSDDTRVVLQLLVELYSAALRLPEGEPAEDEIESTSHEEWLRIYRRCASLPVDHYYEVFNPLQQTDVEPVGATIGDDLADIHRDLRRGLHRWDAGLRDAACWEWAFHFRAHWGHHATGALYALHAWWAENSFAET